VFYGISNTAKGEPMKRHNIEFLWGWFDALRRRDIKTMTEALDSEIVWQGVRQDLVCNGPQEVVTAFVSAYDADQEIDSLELLAGDGCIVLGARGPDLGEIAGVEIGGEIYNVFTIHNDKITRIEDYLHRDEAKAAARIV
jgi:hypothetical protein